MSLSANPSRAFFLIHSIENVSDCSESGKQGRPTDTFTVRIVILGALHLVHRCYLDEFLTYLLEASTLGVFDR